MASKKTVRSAGLELNGRLPAAPQWVEDTPREYEYQLIMNDPDGCDAQLIVLTRDEFIRLKQYLAELRGHIQPRTKDLAA